MMRSLYSGVSGLKNHQTRMDVIGNNIANVNTTGFKGSRVTFQDMLSQSISSAASPQGNRGGTNPQQVGLGMGIASVDTIFTDGSLQSTGKDTDLAISGNGFFIMSDGDKEYYTRNGAFDFDTKGNYTLPGSGMQVKGWMADANGVINTSGATTNIVVPSGQSMAAKATDKVEYSKNLDAGAKYATTTTTTTTTTPTTVLPTDAVGDKLADGSYVKSITEKQWTVTKTKNVVGGTPPALNAIDANGKTIAVNPTNWLAEGSRTVTVDPTGTLSPGVVDGSGFTITAITALGGSPPSWKIEGTKAITQDYTYTGTPPNETATDGEYTINKANVTETAWDVTKEQTGMQSKPTVGGDSGGYTVDRVDATKWEVVAEKVEPIKTQAGDVPSSSTTVDPVTGVTKKVVVTLADATTKTTQITAYDSQGVKHTIDAILTKTNDNEWTLKGAKTSTGYDVSGCDYTITFDENGKFRSVAPTAAFSFSPNQADKVTITPDFTGLTQYSGESSVAVDYSGYAAGTLESRSLDSSGTIVGAYSNGQKKNLAQVAMATFNNPGGMIKEGSSLYSQSNNSGNAQISTAGNGGAGSLTPSNIEMSNVNLSEQFSDMIVTQRGFQSNSKIITVSDEMIETMVNMKR